MAASEPERIHPDARNPDHEISQVKDKIDHDNDGNTEPNAENEGNFPYIRGWRMYLLTTGIWLSLFLSTLETTIVSTSLVSITNALDGFGKRDWIVTSYLLTYTGFLVIYAKLGDVFGRKSMFLLALSLFTIFSILCGATNDVVELIIFRAFQGMGASGIYSMIMVIAPTLVPPEKFGKYLAIIASVFAIASVLGPILGGAISNNSAWRWIFLLNAPAGCVCIGIVALILPSSISSRPDVKFTNHLRAKISGAALRRVDVVGVFLLLASSILLVFALEEAGTRYSWSDAVTISTFCVGGIAGILFVFWELFLEKSTSLQEPVFPLRLLKNRLLAAMMATAFFTGFPFVAIVVNIPQRAQVVSGLSSVKAGLALLPLLLTSPLATSVSGMLTSNLKIPPFYLILLGSILQFIGVGLTCTLPTHSFEVSPQQYGYEALMGLGFGLSLTTILTLAPLVIKEPYLGVAMGALTQVRVLAGTISLAICSTILNNCLRPKMASVISPSQLRAISDSLSAIDDLTPAQRIAVRQAFGEGYNKQNIFLTAFSGVSVLASLFIWEKKPRRVGEQQQAANL
ncbi:drug resistance transporter EmrB/QacA subfamily [Histoplasma capsulatum G186AR]|uniref:Drug resistance transporter EmrB/QacA subfamily n=2 Tax=Ajellomyces capsulatus TaxID=5037 RepID=C0NTB0_AJECG|nr:drug resistance transporter EmrB/QacA subfamily [Histoplasma capsulatum G186AR]EEH05271.1 drug resistance transporter EmrB/QacA subfamily [Histoplasma capsulatum G186AR]